MSNHTVRQISPGEWGVVGPLIGDGYYHPATDQADAVEFARHLSRDDAGYHLGEEKLKLPGASQKWKSFAQWPEGGYKNEHDQPISSGTHDTREQAEETCERLEKDGFEGEGKILPDRTWIESFDYDEVLGSIQEELEVTVHDGDFPKSPGADAGELLHHIKHDEDEVVDHPPHYQSGGMEVIDVIEAFGLGFCLGNVIKYILRAGKKDATIQELKKARWYLDRHISNLEE